MPCNLRGYSGRYFIFSINWICGYFYQGFIDELIYY